MSNTKTLYFLNSVMVTSEIGPKEINRGQFANEIELFSQNTYIPVERIGHSSNEPEVGRMKGKEVADHYCFCIYVIIVYAYTAN